MTHVPATQTHAHLEIVCVVAILHVTVTLILVRLGHVNVEATPDAPVLLILVSRVPVSVESTTPARQDLHVLVQEVVFVVGWHVTQRHTYLTMASANLEVLVGHVLQAAQHQHV